MKVTELRDAEEGAEYTRQMIVYGDATISADGTVLRREEPEYWKALGKAVVTGGQPPVPAGVYRVGGRGYGKNIHARKMQELDEQLQRIQERERQLSMAAWNWKYGVKPSAPAVGNIRWSCEPPTGVSILESDGNIWQKHGSDWIRVKEPELWNNMEWL